ncbi:hypothetical protein DPEC_G00265050 [Dallia pectoralis]|uniref:Uncharacterized protein n=1 Tax=Dallia pectoralis TaxID=75939 RepID=A0ACC2FSM6_DALPE|nr:hypothetical protein DPEC_G00265050 [Dallia pectoralis]
MDPGQLGVGLPGLPYHPHPKPAEWTESSQLPRGKNRRHCCSCVDAAVGHIARGLGGCLLRTSPGWLGKAEPRQPVSKH